MMGQEDVVGIQRRDEAALRGVDAGVAGGAAALVFLAHETDARIVQAFHHGAGIVAGTVIDHDDLEILAGLDQNGPQRGAQHGGAIEHRHDYGKVRRGHGPRVLGAQG